MKFRMLATAVACIAALAGPASAQTPAAQKVKINLASAFPTTLPLLGDGPVRLSKKLERASGGAIELKVNEPGALVPAMQAIQAVSQGSVDAAWSNGGFFASTDSAFNMFASVPFGPGVGEYLAWMYYGGGLQLSRELYGKQDIHNIPCGLIPPESSGWFRKEIKTPADLKGLKMRFFGLGAKVMEKMGVSTQLLAAGDIFQALQLGTIDATEFSMPQLDLRLGFHQVAKFYYFPGWHQQATFFELYFNKKKWESMSEQNRALIEIACGDTIREMVADGEASQFKAMAEARDKHNVQIKTWPPAFLAEFEKNWNVVIAEESAKNPNFKRVYDSYAAFRKDYSIWRENGYLK